MEIFGHKQKRRAKYHEGHVPPPGFGLVLGDEHPGLESSREL